MPHTVVLHPCTAPQLYFPDQQTDSRFCGMQCNRYLQDVRSAFHHWLKEARFPNVRGGSRVCAVGAGREGGHSKDKKRGCGCQGQGKGHGGAG